MHVSRLQSVRCTVAFIHSQCFLKSSIVICYNINKLLTEHKLTILWNFSCAVEEIRTVRALVSKIWPYFKHFNSTRQMASHIVVYTLLLVDGFWQLKIAMNSRTKRTLMKDFKCYKKSSRTGTTYCAINHLPPPSSVIILV